MTIEGKNTLESELKKRIKILRKEISEAISVAKDQGDLSENFEYQDAKERQAQNETRIIEIKDILSRSVMVEKNTGGSEIKIGTEFTVSMNGGAERNFTLVGLAEADPMSGKISNESPLGEAFLGHSEGDDVIVELPAGSVTYKIIKII